MFTVNLPQVKTGFINKMNQILHVCNAFLSTFYQEKVLKEEGFRMGQKSLICGSGDPKKNMEKNLRRGREGIKPQMFRS